MTQLTFLPKIDRKATQVRLDMTLSYGRMNFQGIQTCSLLFKSLMEY